MNGCALRQEKLHLVTDQTNVVQRKLGLPTKGKKKAFQYLDNPNFEQNKTLIALVKMDDEINEKMCC